MTETPAQSVGIIGAGTMGAGIAQVAAQHGWQVMLMDVNEALARSAIDSIRSRFDRLVEKDRMTAKEAAAAGERLSVADSPDALSPCSLIVEAVIEDMEIKKRVLSDILTSVSDETIIATNTSSLSITELGEAIDQPHRTVGMHFFNPAPLMKLVEVVAGKATDVAVVNRVAAIAESWEKKVARAADVPGFIVNHVARPYYLEAFRILEDRLATVQQIDETMKNVGGFRMGPLELTDLIGQDVNTATTRSVWNQLSRPPLLHPSRLQEQLVQDGHLGRKTRRGVYSYEDDQPTPAIDVEMKDFQPGEPLQHATQQFTTRATGNDASPLAAYIFSRIVTAIMIQAALAHQRGVASQHDIDIAMRFGVNYPRGPFAWADDIGMVTVVSTIEALAEAVDDERFAVPESLQVRV